MNKKTVRHEFVTNRNINNLNYRNFNDNINIGSNTVINPNNENNNIGNNPNTNPQNGVILIQHINRMNEANSSENSSDGNDIMVIDNNRSGIRYDNYPFIRNRDQIVILN